MPKILSTSVVDFPHRVRQSCLKDFARKVFSNGLEGTERLLETFDNAKIEFRNLCVPVDYFYGNDTFAERNAFYKELSLQYSEKAIEECLRESEIGRNEITDLIFVSTTGLSTPSLDAIIIDKMDLNKNVNRYPLWGLGCSGGVSGISKAKSICNSNSSALVLLVSVELCSLTFLRNDISKSNFIATSLFSDGVAAVLVAGDNFKYKQKSNFLINIKSSCTRSYRDTLDIMGWEILDEGFKVKFSKDIPAFVEKNVKQDVEEFLCRNSLLISAIKNFIVHPGGIKVINAYCESLRIDSGLLKNTRDILRDYGNMSSATVLYVLKRFMEEGFENGHGLMMSLGPGFSSDSALLECANV